MELPIEIDGNLDPEPCRPRMFGDYAGSAELPWEWATERLSKTRNYWIATTRPAGQPHSRPVWGVWLDTTFYFSTGSLAAQNLAVQAAITVHLESGNEVVILEGAAQQVSDISLLEQVVNLYNQKYHWDLEPMQLPGPFYAVRPMSPSAGILMSQKSIGSPPPWETRPAGAFDDLRQMPPPKQFQRYCQGYFTPVSGRMNHHLFHRMSLPSFFCLSCDIYS